MVFGLFDDNVLQMFVEMSEREFKEFNLVVCILSELLVVNTIPLNVFYIFYHNLFIRIKSMYSARMYYMYSVIFYLFYQNILSDS